MIKHSGVTVAKQLSAACILFLVVPTIVLAADVTFQPLVGIPGVGAEQASGGFGTYVNALYILAISIAGLLAVIKLIIAGTKYMLSDIVTQKQDAKSDIKGALLGLLIVLGAVVILATINEDLLNTNVGVDTLDGVDSSALQLPEFINASQVHCDNITAGGGTCRSEQCTSGLWDAVTQVFQSCEAWCDAQANSRYVDRVGIARDSCIYDSSISAAQEEMQNSPTRVVVNTGNLTAAQLAAFEADCDAQDGEWEGDIGGFQARCTYPPGATPSADVTPNNQAVRDQEEEVQDAINSESNEIVRDSENRPLFCPREPRNVRNQCIQECEDLRQEGNIASFDPTTGRCNFTIVN